MLERDRCVVWEWKDEASRWRPYTPQVAHYIERVLRDNPKAGSVSLGEADGSLTAYILDLISMNQFRLDTGALFPVRRVNFPSSSAPGRGIVWEWEELPGRWIPFETRIAIFIQDAADRQQAGVRLGEPCSGSHICFRTMTQIEFPSQNRVRVRAQTQIPYPTESIKGFSAQYHALPQYMNRNISSKPRLIAAQTQPVSLDPELIHFNQELANGNHILESRKFYNSYEVSKMNHGLENANQGLTNSKPVLRNSSHGLMNANHVPMNVHQRTTYSRPEQICSSYKTGEPSYRVQNSVHKHMDDNQISMNFNLGTVNFSPRSLPFNHGPVNSNDILINCNQDTEDTSQELINFDANVILPNYGPSSYCETTSNDSSSESESPKSMLIDSDISPPRPPVKHVYANSSPALARSNSRRSNTKSGLIRSESRCRDSSRPELLRLESKTGNCRPALSRANSRPEEHQVMLHRSESRPAGSRPELLRSSSGPNNYKPEFIRSNSRPSDRKPDLVRADSIYGFSASDSGPAEFRPQLTRSESRYEGPRPEFVRSVSRPEDNMSEQIRSHSKFSDSRTSPHHRISNSKPNLACRSLSHPTSVRTSRSPPPCACPQCLLVQSIKSASWPGSQPDTRPARPQCHEVQPCEKIKSPTRVPPVPIHNIEGSGKIPPALAGISGLLMSAAGLPVCLSIPATPVFHPPPVKKRDIRPVPGISGSSRKISNKKNKKPEEMIKQFLQRVKTPLLEECVLCRQAMTDGEVGRLYRCAHAYHVRCLASLYKDGTLRCPTCQTLYGMKIGSQPPGKMSFHLIPHPLPGYPDVETIRIIYHISPGVQGPGQPHPGTKFTASDFPLHCYLPNTKKGREVLLLLIKAWERRLLFPVVPSRVPGVPDSVSISRIPLKTEFGSNITGKGFPDSHYLNSVLRQLWDWGVSVD
ncbi:E3 ubiquitin-protein ligase DTX4-like [Gastrophryne carolinensis]